MVKKAKTTKAAQVPVDPELEQLGKRTLKSVADVNAAAKEAVGYNAAANKHKSSAASAAAKLKILVEKIVAFATDRRAKLPIVDDRWQLEHGFVEFGTPGSAVNFANGLGMDDVVERLLANAELLSDTADIDVDKIIETKKSVKFEVLRSIPKRFHKRLGYSVDDTPATVKFVIAESDTRKRKETAATAAKSKGR